MRELSISKVLHNFFLKLSLVAFLSVGLQFSAMSQCPDIDIIDLRDVAGYAQLDDLTACGEADTLSFIVFTGDPGAIKGFELGISLPEGIEYAGWEFTEFAGTSVSNSDSDPSCPEFIVDGFDADSIIVVNVGLRANCDVDKTELLFIDFEYSFTFIAPDNTLHDCSGNFTPPIEYNSSVNIPVVNLLSPLDPSELEIESIGDPYCQTISISQDGLSAYLDSFRIEILGLDLGGALSLTSVIANPDAGDYMVATSYDAASMTASLLIEDYMFVGNQLANPNDSRFNTNEIIDVQFCYELAECPSSADLPFVYNASFGCYGETCQLSSQTSFIRVRPTGSLLPTATTSLISAPAVCGDAGEIQVVVSNPNTDTDQNKYTDLSIGFETCEKGNLDIMEVVVNGVSLPVSTFSWVGDDLNIDFSALPPGLELDASGTGLEDLDDDGIFDDLAGQESLVVSVFLGVACGANLPDPGSAVCPANDCPFTQFYVEGKTNCGNSFRDFPMGVSDIAITAGGSSLNTNEYMIPIANPALEGYDFGSFGNTGASTQVIDFCYDFTTDNFTPCVESDIFLQITFSGTEGYIYDIDILDAQISVDGGAYAAADMAADTTWNGIDESTRQFILNLGDPGENICYRYTMEMDSTWCPPPSYWFGTQQVIERCMDDGCGAEGCDLVRACRTATFYGDANSDDCPCILEGDLREIYRKNYGYTDASKTVQLTRDDVPFADQTRFLPCDTMVVDYYWILTDQNAIDNVELNRLALEHWYRGPGTAQSTIFQASLMPNQNSNELLELSVQKVGQTYANRQIVDLSSMASCIGNGFQNGFEKYPSGWVDDELDNSCSNSSSDAFDGTFTRFVLYNYADVRECLGNDNPGGNCLDDFLALTNYEAGDTIRIKYQQEMMKNPLRQAYESAGLDPGPISQSHTIVASGYLDFMDENGGGVCNTRLGDDCGVNPVFNGTCPGEISSVSQVTLDDCGGSVEHTYYMEPTIPGGWFSAEYRPVFDLINIEDPLFTPMAFCGNANVVNYVNGVEMLTPIVPDSVDNMSCVPVVGFADDVCSIDSGGSGTLYWGPKAAGAMPLGIGNIAQDSLKIRYDFCLLCPSEINVLDYISIYDYADICTPNMDNLCHYNCNSTTTTVCDVLPSGTRWIDNIVDSIGVYLDNEGPNVIIEDTRTPIQNVTAALGLGAGSLIPSGTPAVTEEIQAIDICNPDATQTAMGVAASVTVPSSVALVDVYSDAGGTTPLTSTVVSSSLTETTYLITLPSDMLDPDDTCVTIYVGTTLLFCPDPGALPPKICVNALSGCSPVELRAALGGSAGCGNTEICYAYVSGEVGLQTEWFDFPENPKLCEEMTFHVLVKNVKELLLLDLEPTFTLPPGLTIIPGSWDVAYPGGPTTMGAWTPIGMDPDVVSGNTFSYSDDSIWSSVIDADGLEGVTAANATEDENKVSFRFKAVTNCDEFLSGSKMQTETIAADPCAEGNTSSGIVDSPPLIIDGADPADNAQLLIIADPEELNCMATVNTFGVTAINVSDFPTADSVHTCITIPMALQYVPNSMNVSAPAGYMINAETITAIGTSTEICFVSPKIGQSQSMKILFDAMVDDMAECGDINMLVDVKSVVESVACVPGPPDECDVFVQNSLNPSINIEIKPPFIADDLVVYSDCSTDPAVMDLYYEWTINHNGPNASNQAYTVNFYQDVDGDKMVNNAIDNILGSESGTFSVVDGGSVMISGNILVDAERSCPVLFEVVYETSCVCDREQACFDEIPTRALRDYTEPIAMCPGDCLQIEVCGFVDVTADSIKGATGIEYLAGLDWDKGNCYTIPHDTMPDGTVVRGPTAAFVNYDFLNDGLPSDASGVGGLLFVEQAGNLCGGPAGNAFLEASYDCPVAVDSVFVGAGRVSGWPATNNLTVYAATNLKLEYSLDGTTWTLSRNGIFVPNTTDVVGFALPAQIVAPFWRLSSNSVNANWGTSEFRLKGEGIPFEAQAPVTHEDNLVTICIPEDQGIDAPWPVTFNTGTGQCSVTETIEIWNIGDLEIEAGEDQIYCEGSACIDLEGELPQDIDDTAVTVSWTPTTGLDDPTSLETKACITEDITYTLEVTLPGGCVKTDEIFIDYRELPAVPAPTEIIVCSNPEPDTITTASGFANYEWFEEIGGNQIPASTGPDEFLATTNAGTYTVKAYDGVNPCPVAVEIFEIQYVACVDLELEKSIVNIPDPLILGSQITYEIEVCNIYDPTLGLVFPASFVEISDQLPGAVSYVSHTQTSGNYSPNNNQWDIDNINPGECDTLLIDVTLDEPGTIENTAQISASLHMDIDSEENNDDGDQSEDDEDAAVIELACESISGEIFYDLDDNGCEDGTESLVMEPINVSLYECGAIPGTDLPAAVTTVMDGDYEFGPESTDPSANICLLPNVEYFVVFDIPNSAGEALEDYTFSSGNADMACNMAGESDDVDPASGQSGCHNPTDDDGDDGDADNNIDAGITPPCYELAGEIFYDNNDDGCQDPSEGLVMEDIEVSLYECGDVPGVNQPQASTIVSDGQYEFGPDSDDPGADFCLENNKEYFVVFDIPNASGEALEDYEFSNGEASGACAVAGESDNVDPATGASGCYDPDNDDGNDGDDDQNIDAGITPPCHEVAGEIFYDMNDNGCQDGGETLVMEPITVSLFPCGADLTDPSQAVASTTVTDGDYMFGEDSTDPGADVCLEANVTYQVVFDIPNGAGETLDGYEFSSMDASSACEAGGQSDDVDPSNGASGCYNPDNDDPSDGGSDENIDAGIIPPCHQLAGEIFYDGNGDGCQDMSEGLVMENIEVTLYECGDTPGLDSPVASTTVSDGEYEFGEDSDDPGADVCLDAGTEYFVVFDIPNDAGEALDGYEFTEGTASGACAVDGESDDVDPSTGQSGCFDPDNSDGSDGDSDQNIDAGITPPCEQISGEIFYDNNNNGCEDPGETLVMEAINVSLFPCGADITDPSQAVASTTVSDGMYTFGENSDDPGADVCLDAGTSYQVVFDIPNAIGESLEDHEISTGTPDAACEAAGEANDVDPATGSTGCVDPSNSDGGDGDDDENLDLGIVPPCEDMAGEIFYDGNDNGCQDMGEMLVDLPVEVSLYECGDIPGVDQPVASTTVTDGMYEFSEDSDDPGADICLEAGTEYFVAFDLPNGPGEALEGYEFSSGTASGACAASGQSDNVDPTDGTSSCHDPNDDDTGDGDDDNNIDAGIVPPCEQLSGEIFYDGNENGCQDSGEMLVMESVSVSLFPCGADLTDPSQAIASTVVSDGMYTFGENSDDPGADVCLEAGESYQVVFDIPNGIGEDLEEYEFTTGTASSGCEATGGSDDVDPSTGASGCYDPNNDDGDDGDSDENIDAGITPPCEQISGEIFYDINDDGCEDIGEPLVMEPINVLLFECGDDPLADAPFASTTVTDGDYTFGENSMDPGANVCLEAGTEYFVVFDIPNGPGETLADHEFSSGTTNTSCTASGESDDVNPNTGATGCVDPDNDDNGDGDSDENLDAGIVPPCYEIAGEIFYDTNDDGCENSNESLVMEPITVSLYECGKIPGMDLPTAVTMVLDGEYEFGELSDDPGADVCLMPAVEYFVVFSLPNAEGEALEDYTFSSGMASGACEGAGESDDVNPMDGSTGCVNPANDDGDDGDDDQNLDAGIVPPCEQLGGEIFYDLDNNGCEDPGEPLVMEAIEVSIYVCGDMPGVDQPFASTTVTDGMYEFGPDSDDPGADVCLKAGTEYFVVFEIPNAQGEALEDHEFSSNDASGACATSGESDNVDPTTGASGCYDPSDSDSGDGDDDENIDAGITPPCESLAGEIFYDNNDNGCQDGGESLVMESIGVSLYECSPSGGAPTLVASTSVSNGEYEFGMGSDDPGADVCLAAGTEYFVAFDIPMGSGEVLDGYDFTEGTASSTCESAGQSDDVDPSTGESACYDPNDDDAGDGSADNNIDAGISAPCESLAGEIFYDTNENGCQDSGETLVMENIEVSVYTCGDNPGVDQPLASTTVSDGEYEFGLESDDNGADICLEAGTEYFVVFDIPNDSGGALDGYEFTEGIASGACATSGSSDNVDPTNGQSGCYDPDDNDGTDGDDDNDIDAGITPPCESLSGEIFYDGNENGCQDGNESLVMEIVNISLFECSPSGGAGTPVASTSVTDGQYMFGMGSDDPGADICLDATKEYYVVFDLPMGEGEVLDGYEFTDGTASAGCETAGQSDDVDPVTGQSDCYNPDNDDTGDGDSDENIDAGISPPCEQIAGEIFYDDNNNGCQDANEPLVDDQAIEVVLYQCGDTPGLDQPAAFTTVTDGQYVFGMGSDDPGADICLEAGDEYFVSFHIPNGPGEALEDYYFSENTAAPSCLFSGEGDNIDPSTGQSSCHDPSNTDDDDGDADENIDAGIVHPCEEIAGEIFYDDNNDGCQDDGEELVMEAIDVTLYECGAAPGVDAPVASTTTTNGEYQFGDYSVDSTDDPCLNPRLEYFVVFDFDNSAGADLDSYYFSDGEGAGCAGTGDGDDTDPYTGETACVDPDNVDDDMDVDAGITPCEEISGEVFYDWNADGCQDDATETGVEGVDVYIFECGETDTSPANALGSTTTDADGEYTFGPEESGTAEVCLHPDKEYFVSFDLPNAAGEALEDFHFTDGASDECAGDPSSDDIDPETGMSECYDPSNDDGADGDGDENVNAGITPCETIGGTAFYDLNGDGCQDDATEGPVEGLEVSIYSCSETNPGPDNALATDVTNADGDYTFGPEEEDGGHICLHPDSSYFVVFNVPNAAGEAFDDFSLTEGDGTACAGGDNADDVDPVTGQSGCYDPSDDDGADGDDDESIDVGIIPCEELAGEVYFDWNQNGCQDGPNETGAEGVDVFIYECGESNPTPANALASTSTNADGEYVFGPGEDGDADICLSADKEYFVVFDIPNGPGEAYEGFNFTEGDGATCAADGSADDVDPLTGMSDCYDPEDEDSDDGDDDQNVDAGIEGCLDMGGTVYYDLNGDGCQDDATEAGAADVTAYLYNCDETDPTPGNALASDVTDNNGDYGFGPAEDGTANYCLHMDSTYYVVFDIPNAEGESLEGYNFTEGDGSACANDDSADDVDSTTGQSDCYNPMDDGSDDDGDNDVDAGIAIYDLALTKIIKPTDPVQVGDDICFTIEVFNQGTLPTYNVLVNDYVPSGLLLSENDGNGWMSLTASHAIATIAGPIMPMTSETIDIVMTVQEGATLATMMNVAEIGAFEDVHGNDVTDQDVDSMGDSVPDNDGDMTDNSTDGTDNDEDDSDPAWPPVFDLSLIKYTDHTGPVIPGDVVTFFIEVCNQGNIAAQNIVIYDYPEAGLELSSSDTNGWAPDANGQLSMTYADVLAPGKCEIVEVDMEVLPGATSGNVNNTAEIGSTEDDNGNDMSGNDVDSDPDANNFNDDMSSDDDHNSTDGDEDDHDPAGLSVFDLALRKLIQQPGPYGLNDVVRFDIEVCNQGDITAANVLVSDYIPTGLSFVDAPANSAWTKVSNSLATTTYEPNIQPNECVTIPIYLELISVDPMQLVNMAEISGSTDAEGADMTNADVDSFADGDNTNDTGNDPYSDLNDLNGQNTYLGGDEDDHDQAWVLTCTELACQGNLNVSLDEDCSVMVTAQMILSPALYPAEMYEIEITDQYGNVVDNMFDASDIGNTFDVSISLPLCNSNSCWGTMTVEDKFPPVLDCNPGPFYVPCNGIDQIPAPTATENCSDYEIILIDEVEEVYQCEEFTGRVTRTYVGIDGAGNQSAIPCVQEIFIVRPDLSNITAPPTATYSCNEEFVADENGYPAPWITPTTGSGSGVPVLCVEEVCGVTIEAMDSFGDGWNGASLDVVINGAVIETITLESGDSFTHSYPVSQGSTVDFVWTNLGTFAGEIGFTVTDSYGDDTVIGPGGQALGSALAFVQDCPGDGFNTGVACGTGSGTPMNGVYLIPGPQDQVCNTFVSYEDTPLPQIGCTQKIMRRFEVREWWCGGELQWAGTQLIEITDDKAPLVTCPADMTVTTDSGCNAEVILPSISPVDECGAETHVNVQIEGNGIPEDDDYYPGAFLETNGGAVTLPVGPNIVTYIAYDGCYNSSTCSMVVTVMDNTQPVAICESNTVVSLPSDGNIEVWAQTFDDGSFDECGLSSYEVTRMASTCDPTDVTDWDDSVSFCCADVGTEVMVALRVTDASGNSNICMTTVTVQDKTVPSISCPADMTITCVEPYDLGNLTPFFGAPTVVDNCMVEDFEEDVTAEISSCGTGTITRDFTIADANGVVVASCQQVITVLIDDPMVESDIIWPADEDLYDVCDLAGAHPDIIGYPVVTEGVCDLVGFNYEDEVFTNIPGSEACAKIIRTWQVVNWCQTDDDGDLEIWDHIQVIVLYNTVDPVIAGTCEKVVVTSGDAECSDVFVPLVNTATDDCTPQGLLSWTWTIDVNLDGDPSNDISGTGNDASGVYPLGEHLISWTVIDLCGNVDFCDQQISITNTKTPNAVCIYGLSAELLPMDIDLDGTADTEMVTLWASDFDAESAHPCGYDVTVSFSADVNDTFVTFGCGQVGEQIVQLWVTASNGTTAICETFVNITNNADEGLCTTFTDMVAVEGRIATDSDKEVEDVHVNLEGSNLSDMTDNLGEYAFANMPMGGAYKVKPTKNDDLLNGVTTLDIIHIQRHILDIKRLETPYQFIAADVNNNGSISGIDLIEIRKAILGVKDNFTNNDSWRFIDAEFTFNPNEDPLEQLFGEDYNIPVLSNDMYVDFTGVKIADVNGSVVTSGFAADNIEPRSSNVFDLTGSIDENKLTISSDQSISLRGMQMTMELNTDVAKVIGIESLGIELTSDAYHIDNENGFITMSWNTNDIRKFEMGEALFALVLDADINPKSIEVNSAVTKAEAYNSDFEILDIAYEGGDFFAEVALYQNEPNPWVSKTVIKYSLDTDQEVVFYFRNAEGKLLKKITTIASAGMNQLALDANEMNVGTGVIYYEMHTQTERIMKKMILVH